MQRDFFKQFIDFAVQSPLPLLGKIPPGALAKN
jgi:hypothetical protein